MYTKYKVINLHLSRFDNNKIPAVAALRALTSDSSEKRFSMLVYDNFLSCFGQKILTELKKNYKTIYESAQK